jgi:hypothetical protein
MKSNNTLVFWMIIMILIGLFFSVSCRSIDVKGGLNPKLGPTKVDTRR